MFPPFSCQRVGGRVRDRNGDRRRTRRKKTASATASESPHRPSRHDWKSIPYETSLFSQNFPFDHNQSCFHCSLSPHFLSLQAPPLPSSNPSFSCLARKISEFYDHKLDVFIDFSGVYLQIRSRKCGWLNKPPLVCAHGGDSTNAFPNTVMNPFSLCLR